MPDSVTSSRVNPFNETEAHAAQSTDGGRAYLSNKFAEAASAIGAEEPGEIGLERPARNARNPFGNLEGASEQTLAARSFAQTADYATSPEEFSTDPQTVSKKEIRDMAKKLRDAIEESNSGQQGTVIETLFDTENPYLMAAATASDHYGNNDGKVTIEEVNAIKDRLISDLTEFSDGSSVILEERRGVRC
jgi:hypothetical protein